MIAGAADAAAAGAADADAADASGFASTKEDPVDDAVDASFALIQSKFFIFIFIFFKKK